MAALAVGALLKVGGAPLWAAIVVAAFGVGIALVRVALELSRAGAEVRESYDALLRVDPMRVRELAGRGGFYGLGVETEASEALRALGERGTHASYVDRDVDDALRRQLRRAVDVGGASLVVVSGPSKAGKSRSLAEAVTASVPDAWLLAPRSAETFGALARGRPPRLPDSSTACVVWLDDIEPFVGEPGLSPDTLDCLEAWPRTVLVVGTHGGKGAKLAQGNGFVERTGELLRRHPAIRLRSELNADERERLSQLSSPEAAARARALGEFMIAAPALIDRYQNTDECPEGVAVTRAAVDWRRAGLLRPVPVGALEALYADYLNGPADPARFRARPGVGHSADLCARRATARPRGLRRL